MRDESLQDQIGIDAQGVKKGSRFVPLVILAVIVVVFVAYAIRFPEPEVVVKTVGSDKELSTPGTHKFVVARVKNEGKEDSLYFQAFDGNGVQRVQVQREGDIVKKAGLDAVARSQKLKELTTLKNRLKGFPEDKPLSQKVQADILDDFLKITDYKPNALDFILLLSNSLSRGLAADLPRLLLAQLKMIGVLLLFSLVPGLFGLIYRRAFWTWFLAAFAVLFAIDWVADMSGVSMTSKVSGELQLKWSKGFFLFLEELVILFLLARRLRRATFRRGHECGSEMEGGPLRRYPVPFGHRRGLCDVELLLV